MAQSLRNLSDKELLLRIERAPDHEAIGILLERYSHLIAAVSLFYLKDRDNVNKAIEKTLHQLNIDLQNRKITQLNRRVYHIATRQCMQILQESRNLEGKTPQPATGKNLFIGGRTDAAPPAAQLTAAFRRLAPEDQEYLQDFYLNRQPLAALARKNGTTARQVLIKIRRIRQQLFEQADSAS
ncbi:hypothetical protein [Compostibacter hankyongensis]|uniref:Sigma-70 family RNA polymerase sigma factor n=1 Tax=Compostibacter hankyongensis TaxID=1007089 RepID=A0ABP8FQH1_9BACT